MAACLKHCNGSFSVDLACFASTVLSSCHFNPDRLHNGDQLSVGGTPSAAQLFPLLHFFDSRVE